MKTLRIVLALSLLPAWCGTAAAQIDYSLTVDVEAKTWFVEGKVANPGEGDVDFWIPRWTAGAYHLAEFGRFVTEFEALGADGEALGFERKGDCHFAIAAAGLSEFVVRYEADSISKQTFSEGVIDVESNRITDDYAFVTPVSLFGFVPNRMDQPVRLHVELPEGWSAATVLERDDNGVYHAPNYYRFEDSPLLFGPKLYQWDGEAGGKPLGITIHGKDEATCEALVEGTVKIVAAAAKMMHGLPYERYRFLIAYVPESGMGASGLEHSDSTLILGGTAMGPEQSWSTIAHEFFHLWCAERIHVEAVHTPDYTAPLQTSSLWVNEGFTEYFTRHILLHAGLQTREQFLDSVTTSRIPPRPTQGESWADVSRGAAEWTEGAGIMDWVVSMYMQGPQTIFALDLEMRRATGGDVGALDLMHHLVREYVAKDRGFPEGGMVEIISEVAGADMSSFYEQYIDGTEKPPMGDYLEVIGYELADGTVREVAEPTEAQLGARADFFSVTGTPVE